MALCSALREENTEELHSKAEGGKQALVRATAKSGGESMQQDTLQNNGVMKKSGCFSPAQSTERFSLVLGEPESL